MISSGTPTLGQVSEEKFIRSLSICPSSHLFNLSKRKEGGNNKQGRSRVEGIPQQGINWTRGLESRLMMEVNK